MIRAVRCNQPRFKTVEFQPGFNVVLAERTKESTRKDTRNGLGKTTLVEIIHFCLGASTSKGKDLLQEPILGWIYHLDIELRGRPYTVSRDTAKPSEVSIKGDFADWPIQPKVDSKTGQAHYPVREWNILLGWLVFDLPLPVTDGKYSPSFRSLVSYFVRKGRDAFSTPFEHYRKQLLWDKQVNNAFLLNLDWQHAQNRQLLRDREDALRHLKAVAKSGLLADLIGTPGELEAVRFRLEDQIRRRHEQLATFRVHPLYRQIEGDANVLTAKIHELTNLNLATRRMLQFYNSSLEEEKPASPDMVSEAYREAGITLPGTVVKRLDEVQDFHQHITINRRRFLASEMERLNRQILERENEIRKHAEERAGLLAILETHGALEEYTRLQEMHQQTVSELDEINTRIENQRKFETEQSAIKIEKEELLLEGRADLEERKSIRQRAISLFNGNSEALYEVPGKLIVDIDATGYRFDVDIERSGSQGIDQMKVFCYDLMLAQLWSQKENGPGFLIHDSTIFDGVDERQVALALQLAAREAEQRQFQYICCLNSDLVPKRDFDEGFDLQSYARLILTDVREDGCLLGIRF